MCENNGVMWTFGLIVQHNMGTYIFSVPRKGAHMSPDFLIAVFFYQTEEKTEKRKLDKLKRR